MLSSTEFAEIIGVTTRTLARWHADGKLIPAYVLPSGERRYSQAQVDGLRGKLPASVKMAIDEMMAEMDVLYTEWQRGPLVDEQRNYAKWRVAHDRLYDFRAARGPEVAAYLEEIDAWLEDGVRHSKEGADAPFLKEAKRNRRRK
jgi:hypothetical protein